jgi:hypothetical protein
MTPMLRTPSLPLASPDPKSLDFGSIHNHHERAVFRAVVEAASHFPGIAGRQDLMVDVACVALNRLVPRYIRDAGRYRYHAAERERVDNELAISEAVEFAFGFVQARTVMRARD